MINSQVSIGLTGAISGAWAFVESGDGISSLVSSDIPPGVESKYDVFIPINTPGLELLVITTTTDCTIFINGSGTGTSAQAELTMLANTPFIWYNGIGFNVKNAVGNADISQLWIRNNQPGAVDGTLNVRALYTALGN